MYSSRGNISLKYQHYKKIVANGRRIADVPKEISRLKTSAKVRVVESDYKNYTSVFQQYYIALQVGEFDKPFFKKGTNVVFALRNDNQTQTQVRLKNLYSELAQNGERQLKHDYTLQTSDGVFLKGFPETLSQTEAQDLFFQINLIRVTV